MRIVLKIFSIVFKVNQVSLTTDLRCLEEDFGNRMRQTVCLNDPNWIRRFGQADH